MFRKVEHDWQKAYLCRKEDTTSGYFSLKFESENPISMILFKKVGQRQYSTGQNLVVLTFPEDKNLITEVQTVGNKNLDVGKDGNSHSPFQMNLSTEIRKFTLHFRSYDSQPDSKNDIQWQHSQFFRSDLEGEGLELDFMIF